MQIIVNGVSVDVLATLDSINIEQAYGDQETTCEFDLQDVSSLLDIDPYDEVLVLDENGPLKNQTQNLVIDPTFASAGAKYTLNGGIIAFSGPVAYVNFSNNPILTTGQMQQISLPGLIVPGQSYMFSMYIQSLTTPSNVAVTMQLQFLDGQQYLISGQTRTITITNTLKTRYNLSGTAPAGTAFTAVSFLVFTTSGTNSGLIEFTSPQLEALMFAQEGQQYPTPDCNINALNCTILPNGTTVRQNRIFTGTINKLTVQQYDGSNRIYGVQCAHLSELLELRLINKTYTNYYDSDIIADILSTLYPGILTGNGVVQGKFFDTLTIDDHTFKEVLNTLSENTNYGFFLDNFADLTYAPPFLVNSPIKFIDSPNYDGVTTFPFIDYTLIKDFTQKATSIKARGGKFIAPAIVDTFSGNGSTTQFTLSQQPAIVSNVTIGGTSQKTGINGVTALGSNGYVAVIDKANMFIKFQTAPTTGTNNVAVTYSYESNVYVQEDDINSISLYGGFPFEKKIQDTALLTIASASNRAIQELLQYAAHRTTINAKSNVYVQPGYNIGVTSSRDGIFNKYFTVQRIRTRLLGNNVYEYEVELGPYRPDIIDRVRHLHKAHARSRTTAQQTLQSHNIFTAEIIIYGGDRITATSQTTTAKYGTALYGYASYGSYMPGNTPSPSTYGVGTYGTSSWS